MKNFQICTLFILLVAGCSSPMADKEQAASRSLASIQSQTCGDLMSFLLERRNLYSKVQFDNEMISLGFGHVYQSLKIKARENKASEIHQDLVAKMQNYLNKRADVDQLLLELNEQERRLIWRDVVRPQTYKIEEQMLLARAQEGDQLAAFLLDLPRGQQRENAESAIVLMKQLDPEVDDATVVARLQRELGACLTR